MELKFEKKKHMSVYIILFLIILVVFSFSSFLLWKWFDELRYSGSVVAKGSNGDVKLYMKFNRTLQSKESNVVNFTLIYYGNGTLRFAPMDAGAYYIVNDQNGNEIYNSKDHYDSLVSNNNTQILHHGEKLHYTNSIYPYYHSMNKGEIYHVTGYYSTSVFSTLLGTDPFWKGKIQTNTIKIRVE